MIIRYVCALFLFAVIATLTYGKTTIFDFETDTEIPSSAKQDILKRSTRFATSGNPSMVFITPPWKKGMAQWPSFQFKPLPITDWQPYDRLVIDIINPQNEREFFAVFISDSKIPFREGFEYRFSLPVNGFKRFVIPLSEFPKKINLSDINVMHFYCNHPAAGLHLYLDNIVLLRKGEIIPDPPARFAMEIADLFLSEFDFDRVAKISRKIWASFGNITKPGTLASNGLAKSLTRLEDLHKKLQSPTLTVKEFQKLRRELEIFSQTCKREVEYLRLQKAYTALGMPTDRMLVGFATSMKQILPRDMPFSLTVTRNIKISLARNEKESFQVAVIPAAEALKKVTVSVTDLTSETGNVLPAKDIDCDVVGYVKTEFNPPYGSPYIGWWPDPILNFLGSVDIAKGDVQTFWIRVRAKKQQAPGIYHGNIKVSADGIDPLSFGLTVQVRSFTLPDHAPLPVVMSFANGSRGFRNKLMCVKYSWHKMKFVYADFLADYYINYDNIYRGGAPDYEIIRYLRDQDRLVAFNLGNVFRNVFRSGKKGKDFDEAIAPAVDSIRPVYEKAKELEVLHHAYIYGFDERGRQWFPRIEKACQALKRAFPDVLLLTTCRDHSYGMESVIKSIDAWCPDLRHYDPEKAKRARARGKQVWWYIYCSVHKPYPNWFLESNAIETRLLMGVMTSKFRPDGFLYYSLNLWKHKKPIEKGPFTSWNPVSFGNYHGDGELLCVDSEGMPIPTIRLENFRDGLEDYAYTCILKEIIRRYKAKGNALSATQKQWLAEAKEALLVPATLVKNLKEYSRDPAELYAYRNRIAELIDRSDMPNINPWLSNDENVLLYK